MSAPVDVLAEMDRSRELLEGAKWDYTAGRLVEARAAVAELIEAAKQYRLANQSGMAMGSVAARLEDALTRVGGGK